MDIQRSIVRFKIESQIARLMKLFPVNIKLVVGTSTHYKNRSYFNINTSNNYKPRPLSQNQDCSGCLGMYIFEDQFIWVGFPTDYNNDQLLKECLQCLFHELGHYLYRTVYWDVMQYATPTEYYDMINPEWLELFLSDRQEEERVVEAFSLWGMSIHKETGKFHPEFIKFLEYVSKDMHSK